jgi:Domain of unknown function (DUF4386)
LPIPLDARRLAQILDIHSGGKGTAHSRQEKDMTTDQTTATRPLPTTSLRKTALVAGLFYLLTFVSIPTLALYGAVHDPNYIVGPGSNSPVLVGGVLEVIVALAGIGTAVVLYPVLKRQNEPAALGLVGSRVLEAAGILAGVACLLTIVSLREAGAGNGALVTGQALVALYDRINLLSQSLMPVVNDLLLGYLLYKSRLVPRVLPVLAFIGAPLLLVADAAVLFGVVERVSALPAIAVLPVALFEFSLGVYLTVKGFRPSPITAGMV